MSEMYKRIEDLCRDRQIMSTFFKIVQYSTPFPENIIAERVRKSNKQA